eukprot:gene12084-12224_t
MDITSIALWLPRTSLRAYDINGGVKLRLTLLRACIGRDNSGSVEEEGVWKGTVPNSFSSWCLT